MIDLLESCKDDLCGGTIFDAEHLCSDWGVAMSMQSKENAPFLVKMHLILD
jgi:hypothetical protein